LSSEGETVPLFASLYPEGTWLERIRSNYLSLFSSEQRVSSQNLINFKTEILYHYTVNEEVQRAVDLLIPGKLGDEAADAVRLPLARQDLSIRLRQVIGL
jgi:hypothetical protein